jgi:hypothetical protein
VKKQTEEGETADAFVLCPECDSMTQWEESYVRSRDELPPFKCQRGSYGLEVLIGYEGTGGGRWAVRNRDSEEELRKMLQQAVDTYDPAGDLDGFEKSVHFVISHAVQIGWYIYVPQEQMDELNAVDAERRKTHKQSETYAAQLGMVHCPECKSDSIVLLEKSNVTGRRDFEVVDGRLEVGEVYGEELESNVGVPNLFFCRVCGHTWVVPSWVEERIEW